MFIGIYSRSQVSVYSTIGPLAHFSIIYVVIIAIPMLLWRSWNMVKLCFLMLTDVKYVRFVLAQNLP